MNKCNIKILLEEHLFRPSLTNTNPRCEVADVRTVRPIVGVTRMTNKGMHDCIA